MIKQSPKNFVTFCNYTNTSNFLWVWPDFSLTPNIQDFIYLSMTLKLQLTMLWPCLINVGRKVPFIKSKQRTFMDFLHFSFLDRVAAVYFKIVVAVVYNFILYWLNLNFFTLGKKQSVKLLKLLVRRCFVKKCNS